MVDFFCVTILSIGHFDAFGIMVRVFVFLPEATVFESVKRGSSLLFEET